MACGSGKTRVMKELVGKVSGKASWLPYAKQEAFASWSLSVSVGGETIFGFGWI